MCCVYLTWLLSLLPLCFFFFLALSRYWAFLFNTEYEWHKRVLRLSITLKLLAHSPLGWCGLLCKLPFVQFFLRSIQLLFFILYSVCKSPSSPFDLQDHNFSALVFPSSTSFFNFFSSGCFLPEKILFFLATLQADPTWEK